MEIFKVGDKNEPKSPIEIVEGSFGRCSLSPDFIQTFYQEFFKSSPQIPPMFEKTNMIKQQELLKRGISLLLMFAKGSAAGEMAIERLAILHSKSKLNIDPSLYHYWVESFIKAVKIHDKQFNVEIDKAWRMVLQIGIKFMIANYSK